MTEMVNENHLGNLGPRRSGTYRTTPEEEGFETVRVTTVQHLGEQLYPYLVYTGALSFAYIAYRAGKVVYNQLR